MPPQTRIGISGWTYQPWRGTFYPKSLAQKRELAFASRQLNSIEINGTFYSLQRPSSYKTWYEQTPEDFVFSVKGGRFITHMRKLKDVDVALANFFASGVLTLRDKLGPILWQFPPGFALNLERFRDFFELLPRDSRAAARLARRHDGTLAHGAVTTTDSERPIRYAVEIRHESFKTPSFIDLLRNYNIALVFADTARRFPYAEDLTADFIYCRLHGDEELYASGYTDPALNRWAERIRAWQRGSAPKDAACCAPPPPGLAQRTCRDAFIYFDNDIKVRAPFDALSLGEKLGLPPPPDRVQDPMDPSNIGEPARQ
jgi:uncharacterized protein YecE (DUF72 family)